MSTKIHEKTHKVLVPGGSSILTDQLSSQTVPQVPLCLISTRPLEELFPTSAMLEAASKADTGVNLDEIVPP